MIKTLLIVKGKKILILKYRGDSQLYHKLFQIYNLIIILKYLNINVVSTLSLTVENKSLLSYYKTVIISVLN